MARYELVVKEMLEAFKKDMGEDVYAISNLSMTEADPIGVLLESKKTVKSIEKVPSNVIKDTRLEFHTKRPHRGHMGVYRIEFKGSKKEVMYIAQFFTIVGRQTAFQKVTIGTEKGYKKLHAILEKKDRVTRIPKGIAKIDMTAFGLNYNDKINIPKTPIFSPIYKDIVEQVDYFFSHIDQFTKYNQPGMRKVMLVGPPGSGKTSIVTNIARTYSSKDMSVVFATDINAVISHIAQASVEKKATIVILEDAEATIERASSNILNFLDGIGVATNPKGCMILMTTNFPQKIEKRIIQRPGRVDKIFKQGELEGIYALECAKLYFPEGVITDEEYKNVFSGLTGAQIKELAISTVSVAVSNGKDISPTLVEEVKKRMKDDLKNVYEFAEETSEMLKMHSLGF